MVAHVIRQREWTEQELKAEGLSYYERKKDVVMARRLPQGTGRLHIAVDYETLVVEDGHIICYKPGDQALESLDSYEHWPCREDIFRETYKPWDEPDWKPGKAERDLMQRGCTPFFKAAGVWAKRLTKPTYVQSMESPQPALIPAGQWLVIGQDGGPYHMNDKAFRERYIMR